MKPKFKKNDQRRTLIILLAPAILFLVAIMIPFVHGLVTSFTNAKLYLPETKFIGLDNYLELFSDSEFRNSIWITLQFSLLALVTQIPLGLGVAFLLDIPSKLQKLWRVILVLPLLVPPVVAALMWKTMMHPTSGVLNWLLSVVGLEPLSWLSNPQTALISTVVIDTWIFMPFAALILLAGLQSVPQQLIEAAKIDGAGGAKIVRYIYLPWLSPYLLLVLMFRVADSLKVFDIIYQTTRGGPLNATRVLSVRAYEEAIRWSSTGRAMAIIMVLWLISFIISNFLAKRWQKSVEGARDLA